MTGPLAPILTAERTALNFLGHLSGIATLTAAYVDAAAARRPGPGVGHPQDHARACARSRRRPSAPAAVATTGATCCDWVLLKDNHITGIGITEAVRAVPRTCGRPARSTSSATGSSR